MSKNDKDQESQELRRVSVTDMLPYKPSQLAADVARERQELYGYITASRAEAYNRLEQLEADASAAPGQSLPALASNSRAIAARNTQDAFEELRQKLGLDELREELEAAILKRVSFADGLAMFNRAVLGALGRKFANIREVNEVFPELTMLEIALLPLLKRVPATFITCGTDSAESKNDEDTGACVRNLVPMHFSSNTHSMIFCTDTVETDRVYSGLLSVGPHSYLGMTGVDDYLEHVPWKAAVRRQIRALVPLMISNGRLYECLWHSCQEGLQVGFGKVSAEAYRQEFGPDSLRDVPDFALHLNRLGPRERDRFESRRDRLERQVFSATVFDLVRGVTMRKDELFRLVAILQKIPRCLADGEVPFFGYVSPYGTGLKFIDQSGTVVEYIPYSSWYIRESVVLFHGEVDDLGRDNRTVSMFFDRLKRQAEEQVVSATFEQGLDLSLLEDIHHDLWLKYGFRLEIATRENIKGIHDFVRDMGAVGISPKHHRVRLNIKFSFKQAQDIQNLVRLLPPVMFRNIKSVVKYNIAILPLDMVMSGMFNIGQYVAETKCVELYHQYDEPYNELPPSRQAFYGFVFIHEVAESLWNELTADEREEYRSISWSGGKPENLDGHFLTWYSHAKHERDDFCDHFACYVLHAEEFRQKAAASGHLLSKYRFFKKFFLRLAGVAVEYPAVLNWTIEELHGALNQEAARLAMKDAIEHIERDMKRRQKRLNTRIYRTVSSWEQLRDKELNEREEE